MLNLQERYLTTARYAGETMESEQQQRSKTVELSPGLLYMFLVSMEFPESSLISPLTPSSPTDFGP